MTLWMWSRAFASPFFASSTARLVISASALGSASSAWSIARRYILPLR